MPLRAHHEAQRRLRAGAVTALTLLLLAGCSREGDRPDADQRDDESTSAPTTSSPTEATEPAVDPEAPENLDPCSLVDRDVWITFVPRADRATARIDPQLVDRTLGARSLVGGGGLEADDLPKYGCEVASVDEAGRVTPVLSWGWYLVDLPPQKVNKIVANAGGETHNQGSYAAVTSGDLLVATAYGVLPPDSGSWVAADVPINSKARLAGSDDPLGTMDDRLLAILDLVATSGDKTPILLPDLCPEPEESLVTSVVGEVNQARGFNDGEGRTLCLYRNEQEDATLRLRVGSNPEAVTSITEATTGQDPFEGPDGTEGEAVTTADGTATGYLVESSGSAYAFASVEHQIPHQSPRVDRQALTALLEAAYAIAGTN